MNDYLVTWEINVDADSPTDAARQALAIQRDRASDALVFVVQDDAAARHEIDLGHGTVSTVSQTFTDARSLDLIAEMLRDPEWAPGMLEDIAELVNATGRSTENYDDERSTWDRH